MKPQSRMLVVVCVGLVVLAFAAGVNGAAAVRQSASVIQIDGVQVVEPASPAPAAMYSKVELLVSLSNVAATAFYDPDPAAGGLDLSAAFTGPTGSPWNVKGFYDGSNWRVRFAPNAVGAWTFTVTARDSSGQATWSGGSFTCAASASRGWARIDGHYLRFTEGQVFFAVGHNTGWQYDVEQPALADMAAKRENLLSFWLATPWAQPSWASASEPYWDDRAPIENIEQGVGNYNQAACAYLDAVTARAEAANVCLLPTIWTHGQLRDVGHPWGAGWWYNNAYKTICTATDFFKTTNGVADTEQWRRQKNFYRYILARWGYSRAIAGWVGLCEIDGTTGYVSNRTQAEAWCGAVRDYFRANDPYRANAAGAVPVAFTKVNSASWGTGDVRATDNYAQQTNDIAVAAAIGADTRTMWASGKPGFHAEFGGQVIPGGATQPTHLHNGIWPGSCAGAAMTPLVWCDGGDWPMLTPDMRNHLQCLAEFMNGVDCLGAAGLSAASLTVSGTNCRGWGMSLSTKGFAWLQNATSGGTMGGQTLRVSGLSPGLYRVEWFDGWTSGSTAVRVDDSVPVGSGGVLTATVPALTRADIACRFTYVSPPPNNPPVANDDAATTKQNTPVTIAVLANDTDADGDALSVAAVTQPDYGSTVKNTNNTVTYTPPAGFSGLAHFTYVATDAKSQSNTATVTVTVTAPSISGTVTSSVTGSGVASVSVKLERAGANGKTWTTVASAVTDGKGAYGFAGLAPATYRLTPSATKFRFSPTSATVVITSAGDRKTCNFTATPK